MTCKDCIHYDVCQDLRYGDITDCDSKDCGGFFKNKADFVEIPCRCKECKHRISYNDWDRNKQTSYTAHECRLNRRDLGDDGFCSYGERVNYESSKTE